MKIIVFSDSHGLSNTMLNIVQSEKPDLILHLGDGTNDAYDLSFATQINTCFVCGNNDFDYSVPMTKKITVLNKTIFLCHGHTFNVHSGINALLKTAIKEKCDIALFGHTHKAFNETYENVLILNPGSISLPRGANPSYAEITIKDDKIFAKIKYLKREIY